MKVSVVTEAAFALQPALALQPASQTPNSHFNQLLNLISLKKKKPTNLTLNFLIQFNLCRPGDSDTC